MRTRRPKVVPRGAAGYARQLKINTHFMCIVIALYSLTQLATTIIAYATHKETSTNYVDEIR